MATRSSGGHGRGISHLHPRHFLPQRLVVPSATAGNFAPEESEAQDKGQEQGRRQAAVLRFQYSEEQNSEDPVGVHRDLGLRDQHADILFGNGVKRDRREPTVSREASAEDVFSLQAHQAEEEGLGDTVVLLQAYLGLAWTLGCAAFGLLVVHRSVECRIARQYLTQAAVFVCGLCILALTAVQGNYHGYVMFAWIYGKVV